VVRRVPRTAFRPVPNVDGAMLAVTRRSPELLSGERRAAFVRFLAQAFRASRRPLTGSVAGADRASWNRLAAERGLPLDARPPDLDVFDWVAAFDRLGPAARGRLPPDGR